MWEIPVGLGTVLWNIAVGLDQVPQFGLDRAYQCFGVGLGMVPLLGGVILEEKKCQNRKGQNWRINVRVRLRIGNWNWAIRYPSTFMSLGVKVRKSRTMTSVKKNWKVS